MNQKHPSKFVALESYQNISVRELGVLNLNIDHFSHDGKPIQTARIINTCETIEIIDISKMEVLFQVQIPKVKTWQISILLTSPKREMKFSTVEEAFDFIDNELFQKMIESEAKERELCPEIAKLENIHLEGLHEKLSTDLKMEALRKNPFSQKNFIEKNMIALKLEKDGKLLKYRQYCECYPFFKEHNLHKKTLKEIADVYFENEEYEAFFDMIFELDLQNHFEIFKECFVEYKIDCFEFLHFAIRKHCNDIVKFLLTIEEDVNDRDIKRNTLLHFAVYYNNIDAAKLLINLGARQDVYNSVDLTPLDIAKLYHRKDFFTILTH